MYSTICRWNSQLPSHKPDLCLYEFLRHTQRKVIHLWKIDRKWIKKKFSSIYIKKKIINQIKFLEKFSFFFIFNWRIYY